MPRASLLRPGFLALIAIVSIITIVGLAYSAWHATQLAMGSSQVAAVAASPELEGKLAYLIAGGYIVFFFAVMAEGPMATAAAAFAASLGYFNVFLIILLAAAADLTADIGFYTFGYFSRSSLLQKHGHRVGLSPQRLQKMEHLLHTHPIKTILVFKLLPGFAVIGLPMVGAARVPVQKYAAVCLSFILPAALFFTAIGYFFGQAYTGIASYLEHAEYFILFAIVVAVVMLFIFKKASVAFANKLEPI